MLLTTSVLKSIEIPNKHPQFGFLLLTFSTTTYIHLGDAPDMTYEKTADIIGGTGMSVKIPKRIAVNGQIHAYQTSGADAYLGIAEVLQ